MPNKNFLENLNYYKIFVLFYKMKMGGIRMVLTKLKKIRIEKGLSQKELAKIVKTHQSIVSWIECGYRKATKQQMEALAKALEVEVDEIFDKKGIAKEI